MTNQALHGQCLCGNVAYTAQEPIASLVCHCKDCQRQSGSAFSIVMLIPAENVEYRGELSTYSHQGDSGLKVERLFCPKCGSPIVSRCEIMPGVDVIKCGTLDDTSVVHPIAQIYCDREQPWVDLPIAGRFPLSVPPEMLVHAAQKG